MAIVVDMVACLAFIIVTYVCGCFQYAAVVGVDLAAAFMVTIAPFAVPDLLKAVAAVLCARAVLRALPKHRSPNETGAFGRPFRLVIDGGGTWSISHPSAMLAC